jgi:RNA polymerase sigma factor (sigma-70 family)
MAGTDQPRKRAAKRQARKDEAKRPAQKDAAVRWGEADVLDVYPLIKAFTASLMSNPAQAEDAAHAAVLGIVAGLPTVEARTKAKFRSWCFQIARNKIKDIYRSKHVSRTDSLDEEDVRRMVEAGFGGGELPAAIKVDLDFFLGKLREARFPCVELLYDHFLNGESYEELGKEMGISASAVRMQVNRCWGTLQKIAAKYS